MVERTGKDRSGRTRGRTAATGRPDPHDLRLLRPLADALHTLLGRKRLSDKAAVRALRVASKIAHEAESILRGFVPPVPNLCADADPQVQLEELRAWAHEAAGSELHWGQERGSDADGDPVQALNARTAPLEQMQGRPSQTEVMMAIMAKLMVSPDATMEALAEAAGVSPRTLYRKPLHVQVVALRRAAKNALEAEASIRFRKDIDDHFD